MAIALQMVEPEPRTVHAIGAAAEKRLENVAANRPAGMPTPGICEGHIDPVTSSRPPAIARAAASWHRMESILRKIEDQHPQFGIGRKHAQVVGRRDRSRASTLCCSASNCSRRQNFWNDGRQRYQLQALARHLTKIEQALGNADALIDFAIDHIEKVRGFGIKLAGHSRVRRRMDCRSEPDRRQRVVDLMRDAGRELADFRQALLLRILDLLFEIADCLDNQNARVSVLLNRQARRRRFNVDVTAVGAHMTVNVFDRFAVCFDRVERTRDEGRRAAFRLPVDCNNTARRPDALASASRLPRIGFVRHDHRVIFVDHAHAIGHRVDKRLQKRSLSLARHERRFPIFRPCC